MRSSMSLGLSSFVLLVALGLAATGFTVGGIDPAQVSVSGKVTMNGVPLTRGVITFISTDVDHPTGGGALVEDGRYEIDPSLKLVPGNYIVRVSGITDFSTRSSDEIAPVDPIPACYNRETRLAVELPKVKSAQFDFDLKK